MAPTRRTARKSTILARCVNEAIRNYEEYTVDQADTFSSFTVEYGRLWARAHRHGITEYDGMARLIHRLPERWGNWAKATAQRFITRQAPTYRLKYNTFDFIGAVFAGFLRYGRDPPSMTSVPQDPCLEELPLWIFTEFWDGPAYERETAHRYKRQRLEEKEEDPAPKEENPEEDPVPEEEEPKEDPVSKEENPEEDPIEEKPTGNNVEMGEPKHTPPPSEELQPEAPQPSSELIRLLHVSIDADVEMIARMDQLNNELAALVRSMRPSTS